VAGRHFIATGAGRAPARRDGGNGRGTRSYVANNDSGTVSIVSNPGREVTGTITVGRVPDGLAFVASPRAQGSGGEEENSKGGQGR
jgi:YVTN family beta-propeller protein